MQSKVVKSKKAAKDVAASVDSSRLRVSDVAEELAMFLQVGRQFLEGIFDRRARTECVHGSRTHHFVLELQELSGGKVHGRLQATSSFVVAKTQFVHGALGSISFVHVQVDALVLFRVSPAACESHASHAAGVIAKRHVKGTNTQDIGEANFGAFFLLDDGEFFFEGADRQR